MRFGWIILLSLLMVSFACKDKEPSGPDITEDHIPPARISSLWICVSEPTWADLCWYAAGDDSLTGKATSYDIRYSKHPIASSTWDSCTVVTQTLIPRDPTVGERFRLIDLDSGVTYFVALKTSDESGNWSALSNTAEINPVDSVPPLPISDLVGTVSADSSVSLQWTVPADPGSALSLFRYEIRYSSHAINQSNWDACASLVQYGLPGKTGTRDSLEFPWPDTTRYLFVGMQVIDLAQNASPLSNIIKLLAPSIDTIPIDTSSENDSTRLVWEKSFAEPLLQEIKSIAADRTGALFVLGQVAQNSWTQRDLLILKFDSQGNLLWQTTLGGTREENGADIVPDESGGCFILGGSSSFSDASGDAYIAHLDQDGNTIRTFNVGLPGPELITGGLITQDGTYFLTGTTYDRGNQTALLVKIREDGTEVWRLFPFIPNYCPPWVEYPPTAFAEGGDICLSGSGSILLGAAFTYADVGHITYCGPEHTDLQIEEYSQDSSLLSESMMGTGVFDFPFVCAIAELSDGSLCLDGMGSGGHSLYFGNRFTWYAHAVPIGPDLLMQRASAMAPVPGMTKVVITGSRPETTSSADDFCTILLNKQGLAEDQLVWGEPGVDDLAPVVSVTPDGAVLIAGLRIASDGTRKIVVSKIRFRL